jgi:putative ABC transport system permease protein
MTDRMSETLADRRTPMVVVGMAGAFAIRRTMAAELYGVGPMDPIVLGTVAAVLTLVTFAACTLPARRAARIDPIVALSEQ